MNNSTPPHQSTLSDTEALLILIIVLVLGAILLPPIWHSFMPVGASSAKVAQVGTVLRVQFIGNLGIDTQIDTEERSFMVSGISKFQKGMVLSLHERNWSNYLCNAEASICERVMGGD